MSPCLLFLLWVEPGDEYVNEEHVENVYEDQAFDNSENLAGKMTIPSKSLLSLLARCSLFCYAYAAIPTVPPPVQSYTNHARKCVRSRSGTHGKISQHNSTNKISHTSIIIQARGLEGLEYKCSIIDESAEATISEYRHKLNKYALRRLA